MQITHNDSFKTNPVALSLLKTLQCFHFSLTENTKVLTVTHNALHDLPHYLSGLHPSLLPSITIPALSASLLFSWHNQALSCPLLPRALFSDIFTWLTPWLPLSLFSATAFFSIQLTIICILYVLIICLVICLYPFTRMQAWAYGPRWWPILCTAETPAARAVPGILLLLFGR